MKIFNVLVRMKEFLKRALKCIEEIGYFNSDICQICKDIKVELARPIDKRLLSQYEEQIESLKLTIIAKESDLRERESAVKRWAEALAKERLRHSETMQQLINLQRLSDCQKNTGRYDAEI